MRYTNRHFTLLYLGKPKSYFQQ